MATKQGGGSKVPTKEPNKRGQDEKHKDIPGRKGGGTDSFGPSRKK